MLMEARCTIEALERERRGLVEAKMKLEREVRELRQSPPTREVGMDAATGTRNADVEREESTAGKSGRGAFEGH